MVDVIKYHGHRLAMQSLAMTHAPISSDRLLNFRQRNSRVRYTESVKLETLNAIHPAAARKSVKVSSNRAAFADGRGARYGILRKNGQMLAVLAISPPSRSIVLRDRHFAAAVIARNSSVQVIFESFILEILE